METNKVEWSSNPQTTGKDIDNMALTKKRKTKRKRRYPVVPLPYARPLRRRRITPFASTQMPLPAQLKCKMIYEDFISLNPGSGTAGAHVFSANGLYDPDITGTGHQPRGFDELMALYDHYVVTGSRIQATFFNADTQALPIVVGIKIHDNTSVLSTANDYIETGNCVFRGLCQNETNPMTTLVNQVGIEKYLGRDPKGDNQLKGSQASNPTETCTFHVFSEAFDAASDPGVTWVRVCIEYAVTLIEPKRTAQS